jgi:DNA-binding winged helix-turn-helix (wHTH) protein
VTPKGLQFPPFRLDALNQCLWRGTDQISLSPKAFSVLLYLAERQGRLVTKQELLDAVWPDIHVTEGVLKRAVLEIRKALDDDADEPRFIQTLHRRGYRFLSASAPEEPPAESAVEEAGIVGRAREFRQLDDWFENAIESSRQVVFISGEAGLGKTTLVDTWMHTLPRRGVVSGTGGVALARGRCLQQFGSGEPYLPVFEALDQLGQTLGRRLVEHLRSRAPTWLLHMPALISLEDRIKLRDEVFGSTRERMLREIADALEALSAEIPVVMVLEDLHWSDPSTIDLLAWIARRPSPARLMILATYRPSDTGGASSPLLIAQNELLLHRQCRVMPLAYFSETETSQYVTARLAGADSPDLAAALHRRTNGNPLYVVCLVDELERSGQIAGGTESIRHMVPETLQQMFERQAGQLDSRVQEMLEIAAAAGESFSVVGVASGLGRDASEVEAQCEELVRRNVILKQGDLFRFPDGNESPGYSFIHALCRDALYRRVPAGRRARLHGMLALVEERLYESDPKRIAGELAGHFALAGDIGRAIRYLRMAAEMAASRQSNQEATRYLERALALVGRLRESDRPLMRMDTLEQRAFLRMSHWDLQGAVADLRAVAHEARLAGAADRESRALLESVQGLIVLDYRQALAAIDEGQAALGGSPDPVIGAMIELCRQFTGIYLFGWSAERAAAFQAALPAVASITDPRIRSRISMMEAAILCLSADFLAAGERAEEARGASRKTGIFFEYFGATLFLHWAYIHRGDLGAALRVANEDRELALRNGSPLPHQWLTVRSGWSKMEAFEFQEPLAIYERFAATPGLLAQRHNYPMLLWWGQARLGAGDVEGAWEVLDILHQRICEGGYPFQVVCPLANHRAECALARKDMQQARDLAAYLVRIAEEHHELSYLARGHRLLAELDLRAGDLVSAEAHVSLAKAALEHCEAWTVEWLVYATASRVCVHSGRDAESAVARERALRAAHRVADTLASEPVLRESFLARVARDLPAVRATST